MSHSLTNVWLHAISGTKDRMPMIHQSVEQRIYKHLQEQLIEINCPARIINGMPDHVHLLFRQNPKMAIDDIMKQIKGNTSFWINENNLLSGKFAWQTGYSAYSVNQSQIEKVAEYIANQKQHHAKITFAQEYEEFLKFNGLGLINR